MYKVYDKREAIRQVQTYLSKGGDPSIYVAPSGIFDKSTADSVIYFQNKKGFVATGIVDMETFDAFYAEFLNKKQIETVSNYFGNELHFPVLPGDCAEGIREINRMLIKLLDFYGYNHSLTDSRYYSAKTSEAVLTLKEVYMFDMIDNIDEKMFLMMVKDIRSINTD